jgi:predicted HTH transcriptional regulator
MINSGDASKKTLRDLLHSGGENEHIDFKEKFDITTDHQATDFSKDAVAMKNVGGGYIVLGVKDKTWQPVGFTAPLLIDTKMLRDAIQKTLGVYIEVDIVFHRTFAP